MVNGFALGGFARGAKTAEDILAKERALDQSQEQNALARDQFGLNQQKFGLDQKRFGLQERQVGIAEKQARNQEQRLFRAEIDKSVSSTLDVIGQVINNSKAAGADPEAIRKSIAPLASDVQQILAKSGQDPERYLNAIEAQISAPLSQEAQLKQAQTELVQANTAAKKEQGQLTTKTKNTLQNNILASNDALSRLDSIAQRFSPDFLTAKGYADFLTAFAQDKSGLVGLSGRQKKLLQDRTEFKNEVEQLFNSYRKQITGAQAAVQELNFLRSVMLSTSTSPEQFIGAFNQLGDLLKRVREQSQTTLQKGVFFNDPNLGSQKIGKPQERSQFFQLADPASESLVMDQARKAIAEGKARSAVIQRLKELNINPGGL